MSNRFAVIPGSRFSAPQSERNMSIRFAAVPACQHGVPQVDVWGFFDGQTVEFLDR